MPDEPQILRARQHLHEGEKLAVALREAIDEQEAHGQPTEATRRLLSEVLVTCERMRCRCS